MMCSSRDGYIITSSRTPNLILPEDQPSPPLVTYEVGYEEEVMDGWG